MKKTQIENFKLKTIKTEIKKLPGWIQSQNGDDKRVNELEDRSMKIIQYKQQRKNLLETNRASNTCGKKIQSINLCHESPRKKGENNVLLKIVEEIMAKN